MMAMMPGGEGFGLNSFETATMILTEAFHGKGPQEGGAGDAEPLLYPLDDGSGSAALEVPRTQDDDSATAADKLLV